jgi:glucose/arabinose dehydrogenase
MALYDQCISVLLISLGLAACGGGGGSGGNTAPKPPPPTTNYSISITSNLNGTVVASNYTDTLTETCSPGAACTFNYNQNTQVVLTAQPQLHYRFKQWSGDCNGGGPCSITPTINHNISATYELIPGSTQACIETIPTPNIPDISWQIVVSSLTNPVAIASASGINNRLYIGEQGGIIRTVSNGSLDAGNFLDISDRVLSAGGSTLDNLSGLMSLAFHPQFATNGLFYLYYISERDSLPNITHGQCQTSDVCVIVSEFDNNEITDGIPSAQAERILLDIPMTTATRLGGHLAFGPEAIPMLTISVGDGGAFASSYTTNYTGKLLRIDVNNQDAGLEYSIPNSNPVQLADNVSNAYISNTGKQEIWSYGFSNPWQFSFDALNGALYLVDNNDTLQEINAIQPGLFYGWDICTGDYGVGSVDCQEFNGSNTIQANAVYQTAPLLLHTFYNNPDWSTMMGGIMYRGSQYASLCGTYIYGDYINGNISSLRYDGSSISEQKDLTSLPGVIAFGTDQDFEIYAVVRSTGILYQLTVP